MPSSSAGPGLAEGAAAPWAPPGAAESGVPEGAATYSFQQLDAPRSVAVHEVGDVLSMAVAEAEQIREQARAAGEAEGRAAGLAAARAESEPVTAAMRAAVGALEALQTEMVAALEHDAVAVALALSEQILAGVLLVEPERVVDVARNALRHLVERRRVTLVVNPADLDLMSASVAGLQSELGGIEHLAVQADRRVSRGGAIARTQAGEIDATVEAQLSRAAEVAASVLASGPGDAS